VSPGTDAGSAHAHRGLLPRRWTRENFSPGRHGQTPGHHHQCPVDSRAQAPTMLEGRMAAAARHGVSRSFHHNSEAQDAVIPGLFHIVECRLRLPIAVIRGWCTIRSIRQLCCGNAHEPHTIAIDRTTADASMLFGCFLRAPAPAAQRWKPDIPQSLGRGALADWATPVAGLNLRPTHISVKEYYSLTVENLRTYPVYFPGREPDGYWEMLQHIGPKPLIEPEDCKQRPTGSRQVGGCSTKPIICTCERWIPGLSPRPGARDIRPGPRGSAARRHRVRLALGADETGCGSVIRKLQQLPSLVFLRRETRPWRFVVRRGVPHT
jgi:hypothetical protein